MSRKNTEFAVPRFTETKPKYRNETEIPKRTIKNIGKMHIVSKCWDEIDKEVFSYIYYTLTLIQYKIFTQEEINDK